MFSFLLCLRRGNDDPEVFPGKIDDLIDVGGELQRVHPRGGERVGDDLSGVSVHRLDGEEPGFEQLVYLLRGGDLVPSGVDEPLQHRRIDHSPEVVVLRGSALGAATLDLDAVFPVGQVPKTVRDRFEVEASALFGDVQGVHGSVFLHADLIDGQAELLGDLVHRQFCYFFFTIFFLKNQTIPVFI